MRINNFDCNQRTNTKPSFKMVLKLDLQDVKGVEVTALNVALSRIKNIAQGVEIELAKKDGCIVAITSKDNKTFREKLIYAFKAKVWHNSGVKTAGLDLKTLETLWIKTASESKDKYLAVVEAAKPALGK